MAQATTGFGEDHRILIRLPGQSSRPPTTRRNSLTGSGRKTGRLSRRDNHSSASCAASRQRHDIVCELFHESLNRVLAFLPAVGRENKEVELTMNTRTTPTGRSHASQLHRIRALAGTVLTAGLLTACGYMDDSGSTDGLAAAKSINDSAAARNTQQNSGEDTGFDTPGPVAAATAAATTSDAPSPAASASEPAAAAPSPAPSPTPSPAPVGSGNPNPGATINSVDTIVNDMKLMNDLALAGVNRSSGWATGPGHVIMGNDPRGSHTPSWFQVDNSYFKSAAYWNAIIPWVVVFDGVGNDARNTRVQLRNMKLYMKSKSTGAWKLISSTPRVGGSNYPKSLQGSNVTDPDLRNESDGSVSVLPPGGDLVFHGWGSLTGLSGSDVGAIFLTIQARLVVNDSNGTDDRARAKYLVHVGGDYYPETSTRVTEMGPGYFFPGIGVSRAKLVTKEWQALNFATIDVGVEDPGGGTITEAQLRAAPPPLE
jgi:hypothetical protein